MSGRIKIGLALGGGGARGLAHLGVLEVLEREGIVFDAIAGTSFGAIAGAMYAQNVNIEQILRQVRHILTSKAFRRTQLFFIKRHYEEKKGTNFISNLKAYLETGMFFGISTRRPSLIREADFLYYINVLLDDCDIEQAKIPFVAVATDLASGREVVLSKGPIRRAVAASCAIPGVFPPIKMGELRLIDGGWVNPVPVSPLIQLGVDVTIAVDTAEDERTQRVYANGIEIALRASEITRRVLSMAETQKADIVIRPEIGRIHWSDFQLYEEAFKKGEEAATQKIDTLKRILLSKEKP